MLNFEIRYTKALVILCILAVIFIGLSFVLPIEYSYENHFLVEFRSCNFIFRYCNLYRENTRFYFI